MAFLKGLSDFFFGSQPQTQQASRFTPQQAGLQNQGIQQLMQMLQQGQGKAPSFDPIAQKAQTQFNTQTIPSLAERFTALGGGQNSSAFQGALGSAGAGLQENLAAQGSQFGLQQNAQNQQLMQLLAGLSTQPQFEHLIFGGQPGALQGLAQGVGNFVSPSIGSGIGQGASWLRGLLGGS